MSTAFETARKNVFGCLDEEDLMPGKLGKALIDAQNSGSWAEVTQLFKDVRKRRGDDNVEAAIRVAKGELDVRLATFGVIKPATLLLIDKSTQERLLSGEKFPLAHPDGKNYKKDFFEMTIGEVSQLLGDEGYIHTPGRQRIGPTKKSRGEITLDCRDVIYDKIEKKLILKANGRTHQATDVDFQVEQLSKHGLLDAYKADFVAATKRLTSKEEAA